MNPETRDKILEQIRNCNTSFMPTQMYELERILNSLTDDEPKDVYCDYCLQNYEEVTPSQIAKRLIDDFWYEKYSDIPLDGMFRKFVDWLDQREES